MDPLQLIVVTGAAGAFFWVLKWIVDGKLHSDSEVQGLREDKIALLQINAKQASAMEASNKQLASALALLRDVESNGK